MLDLADLASVASSCIRFKAIAQRVFAIDPERKTLDLESLLDHRLTTATMILRRFGHLITTFICVVRVPNRFCDKYRLLLNHVITYSGDHLKLLRLEWFTMDYQLMSRLPLFFSKFNTIDISFCQILPYNNRLLFASCKQLAKLKISHADAFYRSAVENVYPNLVSLSFESVNDINETDLERFLVNHSNLKEIRLSQNCQQVHDTVFHLHFLETINLNCREIEVLGV